MRTLVRILAAISGLLVGLFLSYVYLANLMADKTSMKMFLSLPMWEFYQPTFADYLLAAIILLASAIFIYWAVIRITAPVTTKKVRAAL